MNREIEKKYFIKKLPEYTNIDKYKMIEQKYLSITDNAETRVRKTKNSDGVTKYSLTYKRGKGRIREETIIEIDKRTFEKIWHSIEGQSLKKTRYYVLYDNNIVEVDCFTNPKLDDVAEIEFKSKKEMDSFEPPIWFKEETDLKNKDFYEMIQ